MCLKILSTALGRRDRVRIHTLSPTLCGCLPHWVPHMHIDTFSVHTSTHAETCPSPSGLAVQGYYRYLWNAL